MGGENVKLGVNSERGSSDAGTDTKEPNSESGDVTDGKRRWEIVGRVFGGSGLLTGSRVGEARGVAGEKRVANLSIASLASRSTSA